MARAIALDDGLAALTLRAMAARAGVTPALVAHYHPAMDELVAATFVGVVSAEVEDVRAILSAEAGPTAQLAALIETLLNGSRDDVTVVWVEAWALGRRNDALAAAVREQMDAWRDVIASVIRTGVASGDFHADDPAAVAWQLLGMIDGLNAQALVRWGGVGDRGRLLARGVEGMLGLSRDALAARGAH